MKKKIIDAITAIDSLVIITTACMLDSESSVPLYVCAGAMAVLAVIFWMKGRW